VECDAVAGDDSARIVTVRSDNGKVTVRTAN
jgi:hypothetical protein